MHLRRLMVPPKGTRTRTLSDEEVAEAEEERKNASAEDVTTFEEDDDPLANVGEETESDEDLGEEGT
jgi:hypothetical protein